MATCAVTVILPMRDAAPYAEAAVRQVRSQSMSDFQCVVVDDGSTDDTLRRVRDAIDGDNRFTVLALTAPVGVATARNAALDSAVGTWIWFVDVDDQWSPRSLDVMLEHADSETDLVVCGAVEAFEGKTMRVPSPRSSSLDTAGALTALLRGDMQGYLWNKLVRRTVLGSSPFPPLTSKSDIVGLIGVLPRVRTVRVARDVLYRYVRRSGSITASRQNLPSNARLAAEAVVVGGWSDLDGVDASDVAYFRLRCALSYVHDALRFDRDWDFGLSRQQMRHGVTLQGLVRAVRLRSWQVCAKGVAVRVSPRGYAVVAGRRTRKR